MDVSVVKLDIEALLKETKTKLEAMFRKKRDLANNIARVAEELALHHKTDYNLKFAFPNARKLYDPLLELTNMTVPPLKPELDNEKDEEEWRKQWEDPPFFPVNVKPDPFFQNISINLTMSAVHVPVNIYYGLNATKNSIKWSSGLDPVFQENRKEDPESYWQFFCSTDGFLRIYPLHYWRYPEFFMNIAQAPPPNQPQYIKPIDLYDCQLRPWFIKAAASPKDIIILFDSSGSMKGKHT